MWLHKRMGHPSRATMIQSILNGTWTGIISNITPQSIHSVMSRMHCTACGMCKMHKRPVNQGEGLHGNHPGEELSVDYQGKISPTSVRGYNGFYLFKDKFSGYRHCILVKDKTAKTYMNAVEQVIEFYNSHGFPVEKIRCDAGSTENDSTVVSTLNTKHFIKVDPAAVEHQNQNFVEREAQTLIRGVGCLLIDQHSLSNKWWCYAVQSWIQTANTRPHSNKLIEGSPSCAEIVTTVVPDINTRYRFPFGCPVTSIRAGQKDQKYNPIAEFGIAIGSTNGENGSTLVLIPGKGIKPVERYDVQVLLTPAHRNDKDDKTMLLPQETEGKGIQFHSPSDCVEIGDAMTQGAQKGTLGFSIFDVPTQIEEPTQDTNQTSYNLRNTTQGMNSRTRSHRMDFIVQSARVFMAKSSTRTASNPTLAQAKKSPEWPEWSKAIQSELQMLTDMGCYTWIKREDIPPGKQILNSSMDLKTKYDSRGAKIKNKARLVVMGNQEWANLRDTYAPTVNAKTINLLLALATQTDMILYGIDIAGAFITADIDEPVYMRLPDNLVPNDAEGNTLLWKLLKTLYGLTRAPKAFYDALSKFLIENGYERCPQDPCLYQIWDGPLHLIFALHVDDFAIAANNQIMIDRLCATLKTRYKITESDNLESFLGIHIAKEGKHLYLSQPGHIMKIVEEANIETALTTRTPMATEFNDEDQNASPTLTKAEKAKYHTLLGMLLYVLRTRPDISYAVNRLATRTAISTQKDYNCLQRIAIYLRGTATKELVYRNDDENQKKTISRLYAWSDAAFLTHQDSKSHSGTCFSFGTSSGVFHSRSAKQSMVTLSSTEAELYAAVEATKDIQYFRELLKWMGHPQTTATPLYVDNKSLIVLAQKFSGNHKRVRHFLARINYMIEQVELNTVRLEYLAGVNHQADTLTKPLPPISFEPHTAGLLGPQRHK